MHTTWTEERAAIMDAQAEKRLDELNAVEAGRCERKAREIRGAVWKPYTGQFK